MPDRIPPFLLDAVSQGQVVLFLGAGASMGATTSDGISAPTGRELTMSLADKFLGGKFQDKPLAIIADLAVSESDLRTVQEHIGERLGGLRPAAHHLLIPTFRWHGIVTTNYDRVVEESYVAQKQRVQEHAVFLSDADRIEEIVRSPHHVLVVKLHGCVTRIAAPDLPLIVTPDQYVTHKENRRFLFQLFEQWGREKTIVFVGQDLADLDIRESLLSLERSQGAARPRYFLVRPNLEPAESRLWERRKVDVFNGTFADFMEELDRRIPRELRPLLARSVVEHPIERRFRTGTAVSSTLRESLEVSYEYVHSGMSVSSDEPQRFYRGFDLGWYPISTNLDVRRPLVDTLLLDVVLADESERPSDVELYVIKGEAGAGKSTLLRRTAWETAREAERLTLYHKGYRDIAFEPIREIAASSGDRVFLFLDDLAEHAADVDLLITNAKRHGVRLTIIGSESYSLWDIYCSRLSDFVTREYPLRNLRESEIRELVALLRDHESLGPRLSHKSEDECVQEFLEVADRQLLVALHEATLGEPFERIVEKEFRQIRPRAAQHLYLTVCVLNRLRVPVRAGLVSRVHGIPFDRFKEELLGPLQGVVTAHLDPIIKDYVYRTRHPEIADMVFGRILLSAEDRFREYAAILDNMNLAYRTDETAFDSMMKGRSIVELFPDYQMGVQLYGLAEKLAPNHGELFHQRAIFEMRRSNPSTETAYQYLEKAWSLGRNSPAIAHSFAELAIVQAENTSSPLRKEKHWERAEELARGIVGHPYSGRYARHTLVKVGIARLQVAISDGVTGRVLEDLITSVEENLEKGYERSPGDSYLKISEAEFLAILEKSDDALLALEAAFSSNPRDRFVASRLARAYESRGKFDQAESTVDNALKANRSDRHLNYRKALLLRRRGEVDAELMLYYLHRAFTPGDSNIEAQFWYARYLHEHSDAVRRREALQMFRDLRSARVPYELRTEVRDFAGGQPHPRLFHGRVRRLESTYGFIEDDGDSEWVFVHSSDVPAVTWGTLRVGTRVEHTIGYSLQGPRAIELRLL